MTAPSRPLLGVRLDGIGQHPAAWREPSVDPAGHLDAEQWLHLAREAERGELDLLVVDDAIGAPGAPGSLDGVRARLDAVQVAARLALGTSTIGLVPTVTTTHTEPFHLGKNLGTLDWVSKGRAGWHVAVSSTPTEAQLFGRKDVQPAGDLVAEADEAIEVVARLCDSWEDDAIIRDRPTGRFIDRDKVHYIDFEGDHFSVRGPSITPRSPQGQPLVAVSVGDGTDAAWVDLAARRADLVLVTARGADQAATIRSSVRTGAAAAGRDPESVAVLASVFVLVELDGADAIGRRTRLDARSGFDPGGALDLVGDPGTVVDALTGFAAASAIDGFVFAPLVLPHDLTALVDHVLPHLRTSGPTGGPTLRARLGLDRPDNRYATTAGARA